jgi:hypothetical protein
MLQHRFFARQMMAAFLVLTLGEPGCPALSPRSLMTRAQVQQAMSNSDIRDEAARLIGVETEIERLRTYVQSDTQADRWRVLYLHQYITERIMAASLQVDATIAQIDNEITRAQEIGSYLSDRRDRTVNRADLLGILVGGGLGAASSGLNLTSGLGRPATVISIGAGTLSAGFGLAGIHAQKGATAKFEFESNMLAEFFDRPALADSHYPPIIMAFLDEKPDHFNGLTRKEDLIETWIRVRRIDSLDSKDKINRLTSQPADQLRLTIDDLGDRAAMLQDVQARISFLKRDLGVLLASLPAVANYAEDRP